MVEIYVQGPVLAMVHTRVRHIVSTVTHTLTHGEMFYCLFKPHHRILQIDLLQHCPTLVISQLLKITHFSASQRCKASETMNRLWNTVVPSVGQVFFTTLGFAYGTINLGPRSQVLKPAPDATASNGFE